ncbi:MAG: aminopeptidase P family protein [Bacteroides sp.]|nr:aminopeptidase P family protein [Bacteroides sp.]
MKSEIINRIAALRNFMRKHGLSAFIIPSTDPHSGEYVPQHWETRKWISGFTGSAGTAVVTLHEAGLWTDSRYFLQAAEQLEDAGIALFKDRLPETPSIVDWLGTVLHEGENVGIDGWVNSFQEADELQKNLEKKHLHLVLSPDPFKELWTDRPALPRDEVFIHELQYAGLSCKDKIAQIQEATTGNGCTGILISALDEVAWTLNLRGSDVHCNPVFVSYLLITNEGSTLFIIDNKLSAETKNYLIENGIAIKPYQQIEEELRAYNGKLQLSPNVNAAIFAAAQGNAKVEILPSPVLLLKAVKNKTEIEGFHHAMERDGVAMVKFLRWLKAAVPAGNETEISVDEKLYELRAEQEHFKGISFDTIAGYKAHGAIVHYEASPETDIPLKPEGLLLLDSGAQYLDGTTDITRTIVLGALTEEEKTDYTLVLKGFIQLSMAQFPHGTCGTQLDVLARLPMWKAGINYLHGTGHGVGCFLNVHEGPHQFRMNHMPAVLVPGMTVTNEPGIYKAGRHGIRTENTMLIVPAQETEFGTYYKFETLTLCPIDKEAICTEMLSDEEINWFNEYHEMVYKRLSPRLNKEECDWLKEATSPLKR